MPSLRERTELLIKKKQYLSNEVIVGMLREDMESEGYHILMYRFRPLIRKICDLYPLEGYEFEDFFQLAGMLLLKSIWQYNSARSPYFAPYFRTVFRNHVIQLYRCEQRQKAYVKCVSYDDEKFNRRHALISESGTPYLRDMISDLVISRDSLSSFLDDLSVYERVCFNKFQQGHSIRFIAQQLNQTEKQINDALVRCRNKLRRNLK